MGFFVWIGHPKRKRIAAALMATWTVGMGVYYQFRMAAYASTFVNEAQSGVNLGNTLLYGGQSDAASGAGTQEMQGFAGLSPAGNETGVSQYYIGDNVGLTPGANLNQASAANAALMSDPSCPTGWPQPLQTFTQGTAQYLANMANACGNQIHQIDASVEQDLAQNTGSAAQPYHQVQASVYAFNQAVQGLKNSVTALSSTCAPTMNGSVQYAPACNLLNENGVPSISNLAASWNQTLSQVQGQCAALPTSISAANAGTVSQDLTNLAANLNYLDGNSGGSVAVSGNGTGAVVLSSGYGNQATNPVAQQFQQIYGLCSQAQSYLENISTYPGGMNAYASDPMINNFMNNPANQPMINKMMPFIQGNPQVFTEYFQNTQCTNNNVDIANAGQTATGPSTTSTSAGSIPSSPVACTEALSSYTSSGWINGADWPDPNAQWIYGTTGGCGGGVPNGQTDLMEATYSNTTGADIQATLYLAADDEGVVDINGTQVASYSDGGQGGNGAQAYPSTGGVVSVPVTLVPGPNEIMYYITNMDSATTAANPSAGILTIIGTVNGQNQVLIDTNGSWQYVPQNGAQATSATVTVNPGQVTTSVTPNTHAQSILCSGAPVNCMGTQCHALFGNQDLHFDQALTAMAALQQMQQQMECAPGTSIAAGNCQPIIFPGEADTCRTWPFAGTFTNNCCQEGLNAASGSGANLGNYLQLGVNAWDLANNQIVDSHIWVFGQFHGWTESAYSTFDKWASTAWRYVTSAFKGAAQDIGNALGFSGASAASNAGVNLGSSIGNLGTEMSDLEYKIESWIGQQVYGLLQSAFGTNMANQIMGYIWTYAVPIIGWLMLAYQIFNILKLIAQILTACTNEEFQLGEKRKMHDCYNIGTYCAEKFLGFCLMHKDVFCCWGSPLAMIIASQIRANQPNVAGGFGTPQNPNCAGFTPEQLAQVDWSNISLSAWQAILQQAGIGANTNAQGSQVYTVNQISHPSGAVLQNGAPVIMTQP